jgi:hypothetical protein
MSDPQTLIDTGPEYNQDMKHEHTPTSKCFCGWTGVKYGNAGTPAGESPKSEPGAVATGFSGCELTSVGEMLFEESTGPFPNPPGPFPDLQGYGGQRVFGKHVSPALLEQRCLNLMEENAVLKKRIEGFETLTRRLAAEIDDARGVVHNICRGRSPFNGEGCLLPENHKGPCLAWGEKLNPDAQPAEVPAFPNKAA